MIICDLCGVWLLKPLWDNKCILKFLVGVLEFSQRADNCGWRLIEQQLSPAPAPVGHSHWWLWFHQYSILHLSSACVRGSQGLFSWPLGTHSVLTLPIIPWPTLNTYKSSHELRFPQQSSAHTQELWNPATSPCFLSAPEHNPGLSMDFPWSQVSSPCQTLSPGSILHPG